VAILKEICSLDDFNPEINASEDLVALFRNFWLNSVLLVLGANNEWPKDLIPAFVSIALKTPPLLLGKDKRNLEADLLSNSILRAKFSDQVYSNYAANFDGNHV
jgi:phosphatidylinositol 4-kinase